MVYAVWTLTFGIAGQLGSVPLVAEICVLPESQDPAIRVIRSPWLLMPRIAQASAEKKGSAYQRMIGRDDLAPAGNFRQGNGHTLVAAIGDQAVVLALREEFRGLSAEHRAEHAVER